MRRESSPLASVARLRHAALPGAVVLGGGKMGSVAASSARLRRAAACPSVSLAGGKMEAVEASADCLRRTKGQAMFWPALSVEDGSMVELLRGQPVAKKRGVALEGASSMQTQQAKVRQDSLSHLALYWSSR